MAAHWQIKGYSDTLCMVLWLITAIVRVESARVNSISTRTALHTYNVNNIAYHRIRRTANGKLTQPNTEDTNFENTKEDLDGPRLKNINENSDSINSKESDRDFNFKTEAKLKQNNKQQKPFSNEFKNYSNKVISETRYLTGNLNEKQKDEIHSHQGYILKNITPNKKDIKPISDYVFKVNTSNSTIPQKYPSEKIILKPDLESEYGPSNVTKTVLDGGRLNETHMVSDQPVGSDILNNSTDILEDDSLNELSQNTTNLWDEYNNTSADGRTMPPAEGLDILVTSGIIFGTVVFLGLIAGGGFAVYRNRIWNKPQTLSDKCSNADSSGYIDDSTLRENSEEMYSLDNDSFLNSLEAMTIQNYWTDNVKHTKL